MSKPNKKSDRSAIVNDRRKLGLPGMSRKPRPSSAGWEVDAAIEQARIDLTEGKCFILGNGQPDPPTYTKEGKPTHEVESYVRSDGVWRIVRDETGEVKYAYKPSGRPIKRLSHEIKEDIRQHILSGYGLYYALHVLSQKYNMVIARGDYLREVKLDAEFAAKMEIARNTPRERLMSQVYAVATDNPDNLNAAALWFSVDEKARKNQADVTLGRKTFKLKQEEVRAKIRAFGGGDVNGNRPEFSVFTNDEFNRFKELYERSQKGVLLTPKEMEELGGLVAKTVGPEATRARARHVAAIDGTLGMQDDDD